MPYSVNSTVECFKTLKIIPIVELYNMISYTNSVSMIRYVFLDNAVYFLKIKHNIFNIPLFSVSYEEYKIKVKILSN